MKGSKVLVLIVGIILILNGVNTIRKGVAPKSDTAAVVEQTIESKNGVTFSVSEVTDTNKIGDSLTTDNNFIVVKVKIDNQSDEAYDVNALRFKLMADSTEYEYCADAILYMDDAMYMESLNPGLSKEYEIAYETPFQHTEKECKLKILDNAFSNNSIVIDC